MYLCLSQPIQKKGEQHAAAAVACARRRLAGDLAGTLGSGAPLSQQAFRAASAALDEVSPASPLQVYPSQRKRSCGLKPAAAVADSTGSAGWAPGEKHPPAPCPAAACSTYSCHSVGSVLLAPHSRGLRPPGSTAKRPPPLGARCPLARPAQLSALLLQRHSSVLCVVCPI